MDRAARSSELLRVDGEDRACREPERRRRAHEDEPPARVVISADVEEKNRRRYSGASRKTDPHPGERLVRGHPNRRERSRAEQADVVSDEPAESRRVIGLTEVAARLA